MEFTSLEKRDVFQVINHPLTEHKRRLNFAAVILKTPLDLDPIELPNSNEIYQDDFVTFYFKGDFKKGSRSFNQFCTGIVSDKFCHDSHFNLSGKNMFCAARDIQFVCRDSLASPLLSPKERSLPKRTFN
ncbi:uncharacterized protein LOC141524504 [Cotesia typhae]|uniref:uncharacterized protein LOC141524504 n=1 Tax=Cotesia typhae TaxID=2053667 RepID=UPI003D680E4B